MGIRGKEAVMSKKRRVMAGSSGQQITEWAFRLELTTKHFINRDILAVYMMRGLGGAGVHYGAFYMGCHVS